MSGLKAVLRCLVLALFSLLLVSLVPSSAWAADGELPNGSASPSPSGTPGTPSPEPTGAASDEPTTAASPEPTTAASDEPTTAASDEPTASVSPEPPADPTPTTEPEPGVELMCTKLAPCFVEPGKNATTLMVMIGGLLVMATSAVMVSTWGR